MAKQARRTFEMSCRSVAPLLRKNFRLALFDGTKGSSTLELLAVDEDRAGEGAAPRAAGATAHRRHPLRIPFHRGEVQLVSRGADLVLDITAQHYDVAGYARREHAWGTLTRSEIRHLILALVAFLAEPPDLADAA
jgi:hypothetical protein